MERAKVRGGGGQGRADGEGKRIGELNVVQVRAGS